MHPWTIIPFIPGPLGKANNQHVFGLWEKGENPRHRYLNEDVFFLNFGVLSHDGYPLVGKRFLRQTPMVMCVQAAARV